MAVEIKDNFDLFSLFLEKKVKIYVDNNYFSICVPTVRNLLTNDDLNSIYHLWTTPIDKLKTLIPYPVKDSFDFLNQILFILGAYQEYWETANKMKEILKFFIPNIIIDFNNKQLQIDDIIITSEIWDYILYVIRLSCGEKVNKPRTFSSEEERKFYLAQEEMEAKIHRIKAQNGRGEKDALLKTFLTIQYKFNLSFDYLAEQTMAQIQWLQQYAAGAVSYEVNANAFAAGNMKKGKKLDFFIK